MGLLIFLFKRTLASIPLLIGISFVSFLIIFAVPGDYVDVWLGQTMARTGQSRVELEPLAAALRAQYGLDQPFLIQYWTWVKGVVTEFVPSSYYARNSESNQVMQISEKTYKQSNGAYPSEIFTDQDLVSNLKKGNEASVSKYSEGNWAFFLLNTLNYNEQLLARSD